LYAIFATNNAANIEHILIQIAKNQKTNSNLMISKGHFYERLWTANLVFIGKKSGVKLLKQVNRFFEE